VKGLFDEPEPVPLADLILQAAAQGVTWFELEARFEAEHGWETLRQAHHALQAAGRIKWSGQLRVNRFGERGTVWQTT
jgi:hypothetical protein